MYKHFVMIDSQSFNTVGLSLSIHQLGWEFEGKFIFEYSTAKKTVIRLTELTKSMSIYINTFN